MSPIVVIAIVLVLCAVGVGVMLHRAPVGYEDESGFHPGEPQQ
jgi:hypothetical protein